MKNKREEGKVRKMTPRENLLHLLRREGYETVPVEFMLCPSLEKSFQEEIGGPGSDSWTILRCPGGAWGT